MPPPALAAVVVTHVMLRILVGTITVITVIMAAAIAVTELFALTLAAKFVLQVCATAY